MGSEPGAEETKEQRKREAEPPENILVAYNENLFCGRWFELPRVLLRRNY